MKTGITKITITIAGKEVTCTPEQIRDLKEALDAMYPAPQTQFIPYPVDRPVYPRRYWESPWIKRWTATGSDIMLCAT